MRYLNRLTELLLLAGIPGLAAIAFLDSAAVPLEGGPDAAVLVLAWHRPGMALAIALSATVGSVLGCLVLYGIGRRTGRKAWARLSPKRAAWIERKIQENGIWLVLASVLAPPPFPTKPVILGAGVLGMDRSRFALGVLAGRMVRYLLESYLAAVFGGRAQQVLAGHLLVLSLALLGAIALLLLIQNLRGRIKRADIGSQATPSR